MRRRVTVGSTLTIPIKKGPPKPPKGCYWEEMDDGDEVLRSKTRTVMLCRTPTDREKVKLALQDCCQAASYDGSCPGDDKLEVFVKALLRYLKKELS